MSAMLDILVYISVHLTKIVPVSSAEKVLSNNQKIAVQSSCCREHLQQLLVGKLACLLVAGPFPLMSD